MDRPTTIMLACAIALTFLPVPGVALEPQAQGSTVMLTKDGLELVPGEPAPAGANQVECQGTAPAETYCETGMHVGTEVWAIAASASFTYTGTTEVRLFHAASVLVMQVNWVDGDFAGGQIYGAFPNTAATVFWHECFSYELGAVDDNPRPLPYEENGTPGGDGDWGCFVLYP